MINCNTHSWDLSLFFFFWIRWEIFKRPQEQFKPYVLKQRFNLYSYFFCFNKILLGKESEIKWPTSITLFWIYSFQKGLKQTVITSKIPATKRSMERFLFCVKALLHTTSSGCSFWMGMQYTSLVFLWVFYFGGGGGCWGLGGRGALNYAHSNILECVDLCADLDCDMYCAGVFVKSCITRVLLLEKKKLSWDWKTNLHTFNPL